MKDVLEQASALLREDLVFDIYFHRNYGTGRLELNVEFKEKACLDYLNGVYDKLGIKEIDSSAYWE